MVWVKVYGDTMSYQFDWDRKNLVYLKHPKPDHHPKPLWKLVQCSSNIQCFDFTVVEFINKQEGVHGST